MTTTSTEELREKLAAIEHERWSDWQRHMFDLCRQQDSGRGVGKAVDLVIPSLLVERWSKQIHTSYKRLLDDEKASDMEQVDRYWPLIEQYVASKVTEARIQELDYVIGWCDREGKPQFDVQGLKMRRLELESVKAGDAN